MPACTTSHLAPEWCSSSAPAAVAAGAAALVTDSAVRDVDGVLGVGMPVYCAGVVEWKSEYRVYVVHHEIRAIAHYDGDAELAIDERVVREAVETLARAGEGFAGFGIDFGVLSTGETALIVEERYLLGHDVESVRHLETSIIFDHENPHVAHHASAFMK